MFKENGNLVRKKTNPQCQILRHGEICSALMQRLCDCEFHLLIFKGFLVVKGVRGRKFQFYVIVSLFASDFH